MKKERLGRKFYRTSIIQKYQSQIDLLGAKKRYDAVIFLNVRLLSSIILFFMLLYIVEWGYFIAPIVTIGYYYFLPKWVIMSKVKRRACLLEKEAMTFFEVLALSLESGRNIQGSFEFTASLVEGELASEFRYLLREMQLGRSLYESLDLLRKRIPSTLVQNIILSLAESSKSGTSITVTLQQQVQELRVKRMFHLKAKLNQIPTKISIVSVVFFLPIMLLLILSPMIIEWLSK